VIRGVSRPSAKRVIACSLIAALVLFTTVYRNSPGFSPANGTRSWSLSTQQRVEPADQQLASLPVAGPFVPAAAPSIAGPAVDTVTPPPQPIALVVSPLHRPPPTSRA